MKKTMEKKNKEKESGKGFPQPVSISQSLELIS
jgi:hypothetical protein